MHAPRGYIQRFGIVDSGSKSRVERALTKNNAAPFRSTSCGYTCNLSRPRENCIPRSFDPLSFLYLFFLCLHFFVVQDMKRLKLGEQRRGTKIKGWMDGYGWMDGRTRDGRGPPPRCKSVRERTWWKLGSITGLRSTPGYHQTSLLYHVDPRKSWRGSNRYPPPKEATAKNGPRANFLGTVCDFSLCTLPCPA